MNQNPRLNPSLELQMTRLFRAPVPAFWRCWTDPLLLVKWWAPSPVLTTEAVIDARPGGRFYTLFMHQDGTTDPVEGCILEAVPGQRLVFTDLMERDFRPATRPAVGYTATVTLTPESGGTRFTIRVQHATPAARQLHEDIGFHESWGIAASQLGALADSLRI
jgi:uncharacterized protein YndB with AHSA1/START domain